MEMQSGDERVYRRTTRVGNDELKQEERARIFKRGTTVAV